MGDSPQSAARPSIVPGPSHDLWVGDDAPAWWHRFRQLYDIAITSAASIDIDTMLAAAGGLGRLAHRVHGGSPSGRSIREIFGDAHLPRAPEAIARDISAMRYQNRALVAVVQRRGVDALRPLLDPAVGDLARIIPSPAVIVTWHVGPAHGLRAAFVHADMRMLVIRRTVPKERPTVLDVAPVQGGAGVRRRAFTRALAQLEQGGLVVIAVDGQEGAMAPAVACLGRMVRLARGPFALSRLTGAPLVPVVARWNHEGRIEIVVDRPIAAPSPSSVGRDAELAATIEIARRLEADLRARPGEIWIRTLRWLLASARIGASR